MCRRLTPHTPGAVAASRFVITPETVYQIGDADTKDNANQNHLPHRFRN
ncbi:MAG TPA: hypothetical protein VFW78_09770 [Bacteroidia bacterium]|nr:hypothetical protein [Bacteroidia bacterium]